MLILALVAAVAAPGLFSLLPGNLFLNTTFKYSDKNASMYMADSQRTAVYKTHGPKKPISKIWTNDSVGYEAVAVYNKFFYAADSAVIKVFDIRTGKEYVEKRLDWYKLNKFVIDYKYLTIHNNVMYFSGGDNYILGYSLENFSVKDPMERKNFWGNRTSYSNCAPPAISGGLIYIGCDNDAASNEPAESAIHAFSRYNGSLKWEFNLTANLYGTVAVYGDYVYFTMDNGYMGCATKMWVL